MARRFTSSPIPRWDCGRHRRITRRGDGSPRRAVLDFIRPILYNERQNWRRLDEYRADYRGRPRHANGTGDSQAVSHRGGQARDCLYFGGVSEAPGRGRDRRGVRRRLGIPFWRPMRASTALPSSDTSFPAAQTARAASETACSNWKSTIARTIWCWCTTRFARWCRRTSSPAASPRRREHGSAIVTIPCQEAMLETEDQISTHSTYPREKLKRTQTPQGFALGRLADAHRRGAGEGHHQLGGLPAR